MGNGAAQLRVGDLASTRPKSTHFWGLGIAAVVIQVLSVGGLALVMSPGLAPPTPAALHSWAVIAYLVDLAWMGGVLLSIGYLATGSTFGITLSSWNDYSLSKTQMALWTIVVLAAVLTVAKINLLDYFGPLPGGNDGALGPLDFDIPAGLLAAMGIAAFSTVAAPSILAMKSTQSSGAGENRTAQNRVSNLTGMAASDVTITGKAVGRTDGSLASWLDLVTGDESSNAGLVDLSKVQQLLVTALLITVYAGMVIKLLAHQSTGIAGLPNLGDRFVELLALSHASYLAYKAAPKASSSTTSGTRAVPNALTAGAVKFAPAEQNAPPAPLAQPSPTPSTTN